MPYRVTTDQAATNLFNYHNLYLDEEQTELLISLKVLNCRGAYTCIWHTVDPVSPRVWHDRCDQVLPIPNSLVMCAAFKKFYFYAGDPIIENHEEILHRYLARFLKHLLCKDHSQHNKEQRQSVFLLFHGFVSSWRNQKFSRNGEAQQSSPAGAQKDSPTTRLSKLFSNFKWMEQPRERKPSPPPPRDRPFQKRKSAYPRRSFASSTRASLEEDDNYDMGIDRVKPITRREERMLLE